MFYKSVQKYNAIYILWQVLRHLLPTKPSVQQNSIVSYSKASRHSTGKVCLSVIVFLQYVSLARYPRSGIRQQSIAAPILPSFRLLYMYIYRAAAPVSHSRPHSVTQIPSPAFLSDIVDVRAPALEVERGEEEGREREGWGWVGAKVFWPGKGSYYLFRVRENLL